MLLKLTAAAALGLTLFAPATPAQTVAEQLQKAIYAQDTAGNLEEATAIYRQVVKSGQTPRAVAAAAQYRLTQALIQKGSLDTALTEFQNLVLHYGEYRELISGLATRMGSVARRVTLGTMENRKYRHTLTGVELNSPFGTSVMGDMASSDNGEMVVFGGHTMSVFAWMRPEPNQPSDLAARNQKNLELKPSQRTGFDSWKLRPDVRTGGGTDRRWLSATADYMDGGTKMVELLTWYRTTKTHVVFSARMPESEMFQNQAHFEQFVQSAIIP